MIYKCVKAGRGSNFEDIKTGILRVIGYLSPIRTCIQRNCVKNIWLPLYLDRCEKSEDVKTIIVSDRGESEVGGRRG